MFQPFVKFEPEFVERLIDINKKFIVSQSYSRAFDHFADEHKTGILFSDYDDIGLAKIHYDAVKNDPYAALIYLEKEKHKEKVASMLGPDSKYKVYWAMVYETGNVKKRLELKYKDNVRRYILRHTNWRIGADETVRPVLQVIYGELFYTLKRGNQTVRVKFDEIEKA